MSLSKKVTFRPAAEIPQRGGEIPVVTGNLRNPYEELGIILVRKYPGALEEEIQEAFHFFPISGD